MYPPNTKVRAAGNTRRAIVALFVASLALPGAATAATETPAVVRVGVAPGPDGDILGVVKKVAAGRGLKIEVIRFSDYVIPNQALAQGEIEANAFQHVPYLKNQIAGAGWKLVRAGDTIVSPLGLYSRRHKSPDAIPAGGVIAIPNDPTNSGRALRLLADRGLLRLKHDATVTATVRDVADNPKKLKIVELDAAQIARSLPDVDAAAINGNYAVGAGLDPAKDPLAREALNGPWVNIIAVREEDAGKPWVRALVSAYQSDEVRAFILGHYRGIYFPAW